MHPSSGGAIIEWIAKSRIESGAVSGEEGLATKRSKGIRLIGKKAEAGAPRPEGKEKRQNALGLEPRGGCGGKEDKLHIGFAACKLRREGGIAAITGRKSNEDPDKKRRKRCVNAHRSMVSSRATSRLTGEKNKGVASQGGSDWKFRLPPGATYGKPEPPRREGMLRRTRFEGAPWLDQNSKGEGSR